MLSSVRLNAINDAECCDHECHHDQMSVIMISVVMLSVIMLRVVMPSVIMLNAIMMSVVMLSVFATSVIMLSVTAPCCSRLRISNSKK
jgi:hypothetical protein